MKKAILLSVFLSGYLPAQENSLPHELLTKSLKHFNNSQFNFEQSIQEVSPWLASLPSVQLSVLQSNQNNGEGEYEVSVNLPFKSQMRRRLDKQMFSNTNALAHLTEQNRALLISGLIRETIWSHRLASKQKEIEQIKQNWLLKQQKYVKNLLASGDNSHLDVLFIEQALLDADLKILELHQQIDTSINQFKNVTGLEHIPDDFKESAVVNAQQVFRKHPRVLQIMSLLEQSSLSYELAGAASNPINLSLIAREITAIGADDRQFGVAVELPIGKKKSRSQQDTSSWLQTQNTLSDELVTMESYFNNEFSALRSRQDFLAKKQKILEQQSINNKEIFTSLEQLRNNNELGQGLFFQRMIALIDAINQSELNQIYIYQNNSRQNQLVGVTL